MISLFDLQVNGFAGVDFQSPSLDLAQLRKATAGLAATGCHRYFPTLVTDDLKALESKFRNLEKLRNSDPVLSEAICGYHLEGPWLSPEAGYRGAHPPQHMKAPELNAFEALQEAAGARIRLLTVAPEWPGSGDFIRAVTGHGVVISLGHTAAEAEHIEEAIQAGATLCTHLGNGVPQELHRHDNVVQRLLARDELSACFIPDGIHLPPFLLKNMVRAKPPGKALLTTDCMAAAGAPPGRYRLGEVELEVGPDRVVRQPGQSNFAGSALAPDEAVENVISWLGMEREEARAMMGVRVAELFGVELPEIGG